MDNEDSSSNQYENSEESEDESIGSNTQEGSSQQDILENSRAQARKRKRVNDNSAQQNKKRRSINESSGTDQREDQEVNSPPHDGEPIYDQQISTNEEVQGMDVDNQNQEHYEDTLTAPESNQPQFGLEKVDDQAPEWLREIMKKKLVTIVDEVRDLDTLLARVE
ncbi:hypothetical protein SUGI_1145050 [Cryptomeria japonica]|nr:hypothetical protein SUGI_1145050 [Cryptomeria japonica]